MIKLKNAIEKIISCKIDQGHINMAAKSENGLYYNIDCKIEDLDSIRVALNSNGSGTLYIPITQMDISYKKDLIISVVTRTIKKEIKKNDTDFYIIMNKETCNELYKNKETSPNTSILIYEGHKVLIDNSLEFGRVIFR